MGARHLYVPRAWIAVLERLGLTNHQLAVACGFSDEHVANVLAGTTAAARRDTKRKSQAGFEKLGASKEEIEALFAVM